MTSNQRPRRLFEGILQVLPLFLVLPEAFTLLLQLWGQGNESRCGAGRGQLGVCCQRPEDGPSPNPTPHPALARDKPDTQLLLLGGVHTAVVTCNPILPQARLQPRGKSSHFPELLPSAEASPGMWPR